MSRAPLTFRQSDLVRAIRAALAAGLSVKSARIRDGELYLAFTDEDPKESETGEETNPWERIAS